MKKNEKTLQRLIKRKCNLYISRSELNKFLNQYYLGSNTGQSKIQILIEDESKLYEFVHFTFQYNEMPTA